MSGPPRIFLFVLAIFCASQSARGQEEVFGPEKGEFLIGFSGNYRYAHADAPSGSADEIESFQARLGLGRFFEREHEFGLEFTPTIVRTETAGKSYDFYLGSYYNYNHWLNPRTTLYGGPQIGMVFLDSAGASSESAFSYGVHAGARYWISPSVSINVEPRFTITDLDDSFGGQTNVFDLFFGVQFKL